MAAAGESWRLINQSAYWKLWADSSVRSSVIIKKDGERSRKTLLCPLHAHLQVHMHTHVHTKGTHAQTHICTYIFREQQKHTHNCCHSGRIPFTQALWVLVAVLFLLRRGARKMAQCWKALVAFAEGTGSIFSTCMTAHNHPRLQFQVRYPDLCGHQACICAG